MPNIRGRSRWWTFTQFNLDFDYRKCMREYDIRYIAYGEETCPTTGRKHHQGWAWFKHERESKKKVGAIFGKSHCEPMYGSIRQNDAYCSKESELVKFGEEPKQGDKDVRELRDMIREGTITCDEIAMEYPEMYHMYGRTLQKIEAITLRQRRRDWMTSGEWIYGPSGVGKSHEVFTKHDAKDVYVKNLDGPVHWWDGYVGQPIVVLNEFRGQIPFGRLLDLVDKWPTTVQVRNQEAVPFLAQKVYVTSSQNPRDIYKHCLSEDENIKQLERRFDIYHLPERDAEKVRVNDHY